MSVFTAPAFRAQAPTNVVEIALTNCSDIAKHATNYWKFEVWKAEDGQEFGRRIASFSTQDFKIVAFDPATIYRDEKGVALEEGDTLRTVVESVGSPTALSGAAFHVLFAR